MYCVQLGTIGASDDGMILLFLDFKFDPLFYCILHYGSGFGKDGKTKAPVILWAEDHRQSDNAQKVVPPNISLQFSGYALLLSNESTSTDGNIRESP